VVVLTARIVECSRPQQYLKLLFFGTRIVECSRSRQNLKLFVFWADTPKKCTLYIKY
jgi:hypothetical protein